MLLIITQNHIIEFAALIVSVVYWPVLKKSKLYWLPLFLFFVLVVELIGRALPTIFRMENAWLYNFSVPLEYIFYQYLFYLHGKKRLRRLSIIGIASIILVSCLSFLLTGTADFHDKVLLVGHVFVISCCCVYIYQYFIDLSDLPLIKDYFFWITSGLLLFNLGNLAYVFFLPLMRDIELDREGEIFRIINNNFLLLLYLSFIMAMIVLKKVGNNVERTT